MVITVQVPIRDNILCLKTVTNVYDSLERIQFMLAHFDGKTSISYYTIKQNIRKKIKQ